MKISWGIKIIIVYIFFAVGIGTMVGITMTKNIDLVAENYYEKELKYQDRIDMINRTNAMPYKISIENNSGEVRIKIPAAYLSEDIKGVVSFYRAMDKKKDFSIALNKDANGIQIISTMEMDKGNWKVEIAWNMNGKNYFNQTNIFIN